ncbi:hypothetical protein 015DV004_59 [Bacillus phage 015DV004]|nr:hypothetical protein 015DV004_59 [Bacillus phage 015DV004]
MKYNISLSSKAKVKMSKPQLEEFRKGLKEDGMSFEGVDWVLSKFASNMDDEGYYILPFWEVMEALGTSFSNIEPPFAGCTIQVEDQDITPVEDGTPVEKESSKNILGPTVTGEHIRQIIEAEEKIYTVLQDALYERQRTKYDMVRTVLARQLKEQEEKIIKLKNTKFHLTTSEFDYEL